MSGASEWWIPEVYRRRRPFLSVRLAVLRAVRRFFEMRHFVEVETPALQVSPGLEPHLMAFETALVGPDRAQRRPLYLHTSPEFAMKKLLVAGEPRIFQLCRVFRNGERATTHHPEFSMLEWYRAGATYDVIMDDCVALLQEAAGAGAHRRLHWRGREADPFRAWQRISVADAFLRYANLDLLACLGPDPRAPDPKPFIAAARAIKIAARDDDSWDDVFFRVFLERIEPQLGHPVPTILHDYPIAMAALARAKPTDARLAERFEVYVCGLELANAFGELTDGAEQRRRFVADMDLKERLYGQRYPIDEELIAALAHGMPSSSGIALGFDRLVMLASGAERIEDVLWAPVADVDG
ncbi:MAG: EF-P lysine aminoacylase EpmA [Alphaproteobacteria bacterium]